MPELNSFSAKNSSTYMLVCTYMVMAVSDGFIYLKLNAILSLETTY